jgi:predicted proteasome-type protease
MKQLLALFLLLIFVATATTAMCATRFGGTHTKRVSRLVTCYVDGEMIQTTRKDCRLQRGRILHTSEIEELKKKQER